MKLNIIKRSSLKPLGTNQKGVVMHCHPYGNVKIMYLISYAIYKKDSNMTVHRTYQTPSRMKARFIFWYWLKGLKHFTPTNKEENFYIKGENK